MQSHQVVLDVGGIKSVCIYGGVPKPQQKADLRAGAEVVVATPGRLLDLMEENSLSLSGKTLILFIPLSFSDVIFFLMSTFSCLFAFFYPFPFLSFSLYLFLSFPCLAFVSFLFLSLPLL